MVDKAGTDMKGVRDRALLLLGFAGAFRRSELVALNVADLQFCDGGLRVTVRKSKTDQEGQGATIAIVRAHLDRCSGHLRWASVPAGYEDGRDFEPSFFGESCCGHRKNVCPSGRAQGGKFQWPFTTVGFPHLCRNPRCVNFQDDGCKPP
jgi:hypothetical protein